MLRIRFLVNESPLLVTELVEAAHWRDSIANGEMVQVSDFFFKIESNICFGFFAPINMLFDNKKKYLTG